VPMKYPYRDLGVPFDRNFRNNLNANFDDIEHDIRMIGGEAAQQALEAADEANTQAIYAQTSGDYAQDKGDYAAQQGDFAQTQGNFANEKGLYAQQKGDYAKEQGDYAKQVGDENKTRWLTAVNTYADIATTYPNPQLGDTVQTIDDSKIYRWDGTQWVWTQKYNANAITDVQNKIGILSKREVSILSFGADPSNPDNTVAIQAAIDSLEGRGGTVFIPEGVFITGQLKLPSYVRLVGTGRKSILKMKDNTNAPLLVLKTDTSQMVILKDFMIDGNRDNQTSSVARGIEFINTLNSNSMLAASLVKEHDARHYIENVYIQETKGDGFYIEGRGESQIKGLQTLRCDGVGIYSNAQDNWFLDCSAGDSGLEGIYIGSSAANNRYVNCKAWFSGRLDQNHGDGFSINGSRISLSACEAQDNSKHGFTFLGKDITGSALVAEANGWQFATDARYSGATGFYFYSAENCNIQGMACDRFGPTDARQYYAFDFSSSGGAKNNFINVTSRYMRSGVAPYAAKTNINNNCFSYVEIKTDNTIAQRVKMPTIQPSGSARPTNDLFTGMWFYDTNLDKPIFRNAANNGWVELGRYVPVPASATSPGVAGDWAADANYLYICIANNTWKRVAITSW
jgi:hypothetical protein